MLRVGQKINVAEASVAMATQNHGMVSAPDELLRGLTGEVSRDDVHRMLDIQQHMLTRFEKTNEMLLNFNVLSEARYESVQKDFYSYTTLLTDMKKDLDRAHGRIKTLKIKLSRQYPKAFTVCGNLCGVVSEDEEVAEKEGATGEGATAKLQPDTLKPAAQRSAAGSNVTETSVVALGVSGRSGAEVKNSG